MHCVASIKHGIFIGLRVSFITNFIIQNCIFETTISVCSYTNTDRTCEWKCWSTLARLQPKMPVPHAAIAIIDDRSVYVCVEMRALEKFHRTIFSAGARAWQPFSIITRKLEWNCGWFRLIVVSELWHLVQIYSHKHTQKWGMRHTCSNCSVYSGTFVSIAHR